MPARDEADDEERRREPVPAAPPEAFAQLYDARGGHRRLALEELATTHVDDERILWVDVQGDDDALLERVRTALGMPAPTFAGVTQPAVVDLGETFAVRVVAVRAADGHGFEGDVLDVQGGTNRVLTYHRVAVPFLDALRERDHAPSELGVLSAESF